jgi:hypothetical protein
MQNPFRMVTVALGLSLAAAACSGATDPATDAGGSGGGGGSSGAGGGAAGSGGSGGTGGSGGVSGSGGSGGRGGTGGVAGSGGTGGSGGGNGGGGSGGRMADAGTDAPTGDMRPGGSDASPGRYLDDCFTPPPARMGRHQIATKASADGKVRIRTALDDGERLGTSGSVPWDVLRFAIEADGSGGCVNRGPNLVYKPSPRHNCNDGLVATVNGVRYEVKFPDKPLATVTAFQGTNMLWGPVEVADVGCMAVTSDGRPRACGSGGPCN